MIKNIVFDIGKIILEGSSSSALDYFDISNEDKGLIKKELFNNVRYIDLDYGLLDFKGYFDKYSYLLPERLHSIAYEALSNSCRLRKMNNEIIDLMSKLKGNYKLYILSNNSKDVIKYLKSTELNNYIDGWIVSCDYGEVKPYRKIYQILFKTYNIDPKESYFIDDKEENINTSKSLGMMGFVLDWDNNKFEDLINDMIKNGIEVR